MKKEMEKNGVSVMGVSEVRWKGHGEIRSGDCTMYCSGGEKSERGVTIVVHKSIVGSAVKKIVCNERLIAVTLNAEPVNCLIVQVYMPPSDYEDEEVEYLYDRIEDILDENGKDDTNTIIMGDCNSVVGLNQTVIIVAHMDWEVETKEVKCLLTFVEELDSLSLTRNLRSLR
jgi:exonuclease III